MGRGRQPPRRRRDPRLVRPAGRDAARPRVAEAACAARRSRVLLFAGTLSYAAATREGDLTVVSVLGSLFTIVTVTLAVTLDDERLSRAAWAGVGAAVAGGVLLSAA